MDGLVKKFVVLLILRFSKREISWTETCGGLHHPEAALILTMILRQDLRYGRPTEERASCYTKLGLSCLSYKLPRLGNATGI